MSIGSIDNEITKCKEKISKYQKQLNELYKKREAAENAKIISEVRRSNLTVDELAELITAFSSSSSDKKQQKENNDV